MTSTIDTFNITFFEKKEGRNRKESCKQIMTENIGDCSAFICGGVIYICCWPKLGCSLIVRKDVVKRK